MIVLVDERNLVADGYSSSFDREGVSATGFLPCDFRDWVTSAPSDDLLAVEAFLIGNCMEREALPKIIKQRSRAPVIAMNETPGLENTLRLFAAGADDVVQKPVHAREIIARASAIRRRHVCESEEAARDEICTFSDGRDPVVAGEPLSLPRRERRILEYLMDNRGRRIPKPQLFSAIYGCFDEKSDEYVIESHISKLRKKLRSRLGRDPIDSRRYLGYMIA